MSILNLGVTVPDAQATAILDDFVAYHGYQATIKDAEGNDIPNPQTKAQFAKAKVVSFVRESIKSFRANASANSARDVKIQEVDAIVMS